MLALLTACSSQADPVTTTTAGQPTTTTTVEADTTSPTTATPPTTADDRETTTTVTDTTTSLPPFESLAYEVVADMPFPVQMTAVEGADTAYIATKDGRVWLYDGSAVEDVPVLDISAQVVNRNEQGLLSLVLHPDDPARLFLHYTGGGGDTVVSEFRLVDESTADPGSEQVLLRLGQPASNHNGGMLQFGPDGRLYLGLGDGGGADDRFGNGQNTETLLGGIVALSVDGEADPTLFAHGLRNPWRFWMDPESDLIYIADVGQNEFEEVSVAPIVEGLNYGWPITEALHCFRPATGCDTTGLTLPVIEVPHGDSGTCSITGGIVYRGAAIPELTGHYFYSDFCGGYLRSFRYDDGVVTEATDWTDQVGVPGQVVGFGVDGDGEMYVATTGQLLRVVAIRA